MAPEQQAKELCSALQTIPKFDTKLAFDRLHEWVRTSDRATFPFSTMTGLISRDAKLNLGSALADDKKVADSFAIHTDTGGKAMIEQLAQFSILYQMSKRLNSTAWLNGVSSHPCSTASAAPEPY